MSEAWRGGAKAKHAHLAYPGALLCVFRINSIKVLDYVDIASPLTACM